MRSLATNRSVASSIAYKSRTFPDATFGSLPCMSMLTIASEDILFDVIVDCFEKIVGNMQVPAVEYFMVPA
jgi:hypothetical protein